MKGDESSYKCCCISLSLATADLLCHWIDVYIRTHLNARIICKLTSYVPVYLSANIVLIFNFNCYLLLNASLSSPIPPHSTLLPRSQQDDNRQQDKGWVMQNFFLQKDRHTEGGTDRPAYKSSIQSLETCSKKVYYEPYSRRNSVTWKTLEIYNTTLL